MKKNIIGILILYSLNISANTFFGIISKEHNKYNQGDLSGDIICANVDIVESDVYFKIEKIQTGTNCTKTITDSDGNKVIIKEKDQKNIITGTHIESSCKKAFDFDNSLQDGFYFLKLKDNSEQEMYCDMQNGGYTLISHINDKDDRDDILNDSNGLGWGDIKNTPLSDTSFNLAKDLTPDFTESEFEWRYPLYDEVYRHGGANHNNITLDRFNWKHGGSTSDSYFLAELTDDFNITDGLKYGVFGVHPPHANNYGLLPFNYTPCGGKSINKATHYWGYGSIIEFGSSTGAELHNLLDGYNRANGGVSRYDGCGTRNTILNIWIK